MKQIRRPLYALVLCALFLGGSVADAGEAAKASRPTPGVEAAQAISTITGVAISPLLGVSGVGCYQWYKAPPAKRPNLPWFAQPWFWGPALLLVGLTLIKDTLGAALPTAVKKPFDLAETIENKISGLVAVGAFVPLVAAIFRATGDEAAWAEGAGLAMVDLTPLLNMLTIPVAMAAFVVVWLVSHVIHVLILISPVTTVDTALKSVRLFLLSTVTVTSFVNPYVGAVWSLVIIVVCWFLAGWAFRMFVFGSVFTWDLGTFRKTRFRLEPEGNWVFTARAFGKTPIRTFGKLGRGPDGELVLRHRPWLVLPKRELALPPGKYAVGRGLFYSEVIRLEDDASSLTTLTLPPCYRSHEHELSSIYMLAGVHDTGVVRGVKGMWARIRVLLGSRPEPASTV